MTSPDRSHEFPPAWQAVLFPALAGWLQNRLRVPTAFRAAIVIPAAWTLLEWARGIFLTGFPWLGTGYAYLDTPLAGYAPVAGVASNTIAVPEA